VSNTVTGGDLINAFMNSHPESKILGNSSSDEEIAREKISWAKALLKFVKSWLCYSAQKVMQLHILHSTFLQKRKECTKQADVRQMFQQAYKSHRDLQYYPEQKHR
jgi:hypothetical protein